MAKRKLTDHEKTELLNFPFFVRTLEMAIIARMVNFVIGVTNYTSKEAFCLYSIKNGFVVDHLAKIFLAVHDRSVVEDTAPDFLTRDTTREIFATNAANVPFIDRTIELMSTGFVGIPDGVTDVSINEQSFWEKLMFWK